MILAYLWDPSVIPNILKREGGRQQRENQTRGGVRRTWPDGAGFEDGWMIDEPRHEDIF